MDKTTVTGRRANLPFDINFTGNIPACNQSSTVNIFVRSDFVVYVRPDLVITLLGR